MSNPILRAAAHFGGQANLARALGIQPPTVNEWVKEKRPVPVEKCVAIEQSTSGLVKRWDLRPDDWHLIWPELIDHADAPPVAATASPAADVAKAEA